MRMVSHGNFVRYICYNMRSILACYGIKRNEQTWDTFGYAYGLNDYFRGTSGDSRNTQTTPMFSRWIV